MKTLRKLGAMVAVALTATTGLAHAQTRIRLNGQPFRTAVAPLTENGRVLVPMRAIFEALGAVVDYFPGESRIVARRRGTIVRMRLGTNRGSVNEDLLRLDVPPTAYDGRTLVPLRFGAEALGASVNYDSYRQLVTIDDARAPITDNPRYPRYPDGYNGIRNGRRNPR